MKSRHLTKRLLFTITLICCCQQIFTGKAMKESKAINKQQSKEWLKIKATSTTTSTEKSERDATAIIENIAVDERHAFINNQIVTESVEPVSYTKADKDGNENNLTQVKETLDNDPDEHAKISKNPSLASEEYEEDETAEYMLESEDIPENCEDTEESLTDNEEVSGYYGAAELSQDQENFNNSATIMLNHSLKNKPYDSFSYGQQEITKPELPYHHSSQNIVNESNYHHKPQTNRNQEIFLDRAILDYIRKQQQAYTNNNKSQNGGTTNVTPDKVFHIESSSKTKNPSANEQQYPQPSFNQYVQKKPSEYYGHTNRIAYDNREPQENLSPYFSMETRTPPLLNYQETASLQNEKYSTKHDSEINFNKPVTSFYNKRLYNSALFNYSKNNLTELLSTSDHSNSLNPSIYDNANTETTSPSLSFSHVHNKKFKTVSSSVQYVSTPFAELVFKYSIGMAKQTNSKLPTNSSYNKAPTHNLGYDINEKA